jgi:hypothetical protein
VCLPLDPRVAGFKPGREHEFLRAIKIRRTSSCGWEVKPEVPCRKILRNVKDPLTCQKILNTQNSHSFVYSSYSIQISLLVGDCQRALVDESGFIPSRHHHHHGSLLTFTREMNNRPVMVAVLDVSLTHRNPSVSCHGPPSQPCWCRGPSPKPSPTSLINTTN